MTELAQTVDWSLVIRLLSGNRLLALLGPRLVELAPTHSADGFEQATARALDASRRHGAFLQMVTQYVSAALTDAGIICTALKGPGLSEALYHDPGRRASSDIDLLVAPEQLRDAVVVACTLGYRSPTDHVDDRGLPLLHFTLIHEHGQLPPLELHWRIHWYEHSFAQKRLLAPGCDLADGWQPAPIDALAALLLYYARDGFIDLRHATDIGACWDGFGAGLQPGALDSLICGYPALADVLIAAATVAEKTVGLPLDRLSEREIALTKRSRVAVRLAGHRSHVSQSQLYADMSLIDGLLAPRGDFWAFVKRQVILPNAMHRQGASADLRHSVRVLARYGLAMTRLLRAPTSVPPR